MGILLDADADVGANDCYGNTPSQIFDDHVSEAVLDEVRISSRNSILSQHVLTAGPRSMDYSTVPLNPSASVVRTPNLILKVLTCINAGCRICGHRSEQWFEKLLKGLPLHGGIEIKTELIMRRRRYPWIVEAKLTPA